MSGSADAEEPSTPKADREDRARTATTSSHTLGRIHFFPVRHHSPTAARLVRTWIRELRPDFVLVEGPFDYNDQIDELRRDHQLPIALYTYVVSEDGQRRGAFYPFCAYSPEWQALKTAFEVGATARFIDLPWADITEHDRQVTHRYADHELKRSGYVAKLCEDFQVETFDDVWDELVEIDATIELEPYLERAATLCEHLRFFDDEQPSDLRREAFMAGQIAIARGACDGPIVVVSGGYHTPALKERLRADEISGLTATSPELGSGRGITLTPYSYQALDQLTGYNAGMPSPGFYHRVWEAREAETQPSHRTLLHDIARRLRKKGQSVSSADLIAVETTALALMRLRGHSEVWRKDLIDGIIGALVKDELAYGVPHPLLEECYLALRGEERGRLAEGTKLPALVIELRGRFERLGLAPDTQRRKLSLDLYTDRDLEISRLLHGCRVLGIHGIDQAGETDIFSPVAGSTLSEQWSLRWHPETEASTIRAATYGPSVEEAVAARLMERTRDVERDAVAATQLLLDSVLAGIPSVRGVLHRRVHDLIRLDSIFTQVCGAMGKLVYLFRYDDVLRTLGREDLGGLLSLSFERGTALLEQLKGGDLDDADSLQIVVETLERCGDTLGLNRDDFAALMERAAVDACKSHLLRGASLGVLWALGHANTGRLLSELETLPDTESLADFLVGLFRLAREVIQRRPELAQAIDESLMGLSDTEFLAAIPGLRLAFSRFTPREKAHIAERLLGVAGDVVRTEVSTETMARMLALESDLQDALTRFGVRSSSRRTTK
ncbi:MAG: DUF5682 family protein [Myxococcota bacterium]